MVRSFFDPSMIKQMMPKQGITANPVFDLKILMETQRKNMQAMTDVMQLSMESLQQAVSRQAELMGRMVQDNSGYASTMLTEGTPEQKVQRQAELVRKSYETTVAGAREVGNIITKTGEEAAEIINRRVSASLAEFKAAFDPKAAMMNGQAEAKPAAANKPAAKKTGKRKAA
ncbi:MAG: TIGR01841 family phasin [Alphaproteobacteria bacterium]|nr:TIGR01841 family phasin [Alphaproteobacteria bacterium]